MAAALANPKEPKMNLDRTVLDFAGLLVLGSVILAQIYSPLWLLLTAWVGVMLLQSGFTRFCPAALFFRKMGIKPCSAFR